MHPSNTPRARSVRQLAAYWGVSRKKVRAMIRRGIIKAFDVGTSRKQLRIAPAAITEAETRLAVHAPAIDPEIAAMLGN